jgi:hypothetical protein
MVLPYSHLGPIFEHQVDCDEDMLEPRVVRVRLSMAALAKLHAVASGPPVLAPR